ncbi:MAG: ATP-binding protein, partial [Elusimicrobiota bacterium]|nr:ATP-binding protein [Elusimicrobiota bacterium]
TELFQGVKDLGLLKVFQRVYKTGKMEFLSENIFITKEGVKVWRENYVYKLPTGEIVAIYDDVTDRKNKERLIAESEDKFRSLFESSRDALMTLSPKGWHFASANRSAIKLFGTKNEKEFLEAHLWEYSPEYQPDGQLSVDKAKKMIEIALVKGSNFFEWTHKKLNGDEFFATVLLTKCEAKKEVCVYVTVRDITDQKKLQAGKIKLQEQFLQAQKMEALGSFVGGIAHDFNNLLTPVLTVSELSINDLSDKSKMRDNLNEIKKSALRGAKLVSRLLVFSRKQPLKPEIINLNTLLSNLEKLLRPLIGEYIELKCFLDKKLGNIEFDPVQMEQVILNLAANARDAMPDGGKFTIETHNICLDKDYIEAHPGFAAEDYIVMHISDTGTGMDKGTIGHIFDPFYSTKGKSKGTGLGLSTVYGIVKQSGGDISVYSELGQGTTFKIYLKRSKGKLDIIKSKETSIDPESLKGNETILLVEDDESIRRVTKRMLERYGYNLFIAGDSQEAIKICKEHKDIHLIFTDIILPGGMNGRQFVEEIRVLYPKVKVLYMSGYTDNVIERHGIVEKGINFIQKPFGFLDLGAKVRKVLDKK